MQPKFSDYPQATTMKTCNPSTAPSDRPGALSTATKAPAARHSQPDTEAPRNPPTPGHHPHGQSRSRPNNANRRTRNKQPPPNTTSPEPQTQEASPSQQ